MMLQKFYPDETIESTYGIDFSALYEEGYRGVIFDIDRALNLNRIGITITESGAMYPQSSVCGVYIGAKDAKYFIIA